MSRIGNLFKESRRKGRKVLVPFVMAGDPSLGRSGSIIQALARGGADLIEVGIPFSDPVADGTAIQQAAARALASGTTVEGVLRMLAGLPVGLPPLILMTYWNPVLAFGPEAFLARAAAAGVAGLIVVDLPPEEADGLPRQARVAGIDVIFLVAPATPPERAAAIARRSAGFLYCVARMGTTGTRAELPEGTAEWLRGLRRLTRLPLALGFGISSADHVRQAWLEADAAVVGSLLVNEVAAGGEDLEERLEATLRELRG
jgi:tryptophan synthase alpha chain